MSRRRAWLVSFLGLTALTVGAEVFASVTDDPATQTWSDLIIQYVPEEVAYALVGALVLWLPIHLWVRYRKRARASGKVLSLVQLPKKCWAHRHWSRVPIEVHHVWPLGEGGPDVADNKVPICSNAHSLTHDLLRMMRSAGTANVAWSVRRRYGRKVRRLAVAGYTAINERRIVQP